MKLTRFFTFPFIFLSFMTCLNATHYRAGEIVIESIEENDPRTVQANVITYTNVLASDADRQELTICWGDGNCEIIQRTNGILNRGEYIGNGVKMNIYIGTHTYEQQDEYLISMTDPNRIGGILNVNFPFSINSSFHIQTVYKTNVAIMNNSPVLLVPPIDFGCVGQTFTHNPGAFDRDGDSLSYRLVTPFGELDAPINEYLFPNEISPGANNSISIDPVTGDIIWNAPQQTGDYVVAIEIDEWRDGELIGSTLRDMQITIEDCGGLVPEVDISTTIFNVKPGEVVEFEVTTATSLENGAVRLEAFGGPMILDVEAASFEDNNRDYTASTVTKKFRWQITEEHLREAFYTLVFKGTDDQFSNEMGAASLQTVIIKVEDQNVSSINISEFSNIKFHPNPSQNFISIDFGEWTIPSKAKIHIYALDGSMIRQIKITENPINLSDFPSGQYIITLSTEIGILWKENLIIVK